MSALRSLLFIPGDSEKKLAKGDASGADALILDLEDSVAAPNKARAREMVAAYLAERPRGTRTRQLWVRINPLDTEFALADLVSVVAAAPDGVMLPKAEGPQDCARLSHYLDALEARAGIPAGAIRILPVATETAAAPFRLGDYAAAGLTRLGGLSWGAEDLSSALGAATNLDPAGGWALTYRLVRSLTLLAAHAAGVPAIESVFVDFRDDEGLRRTSSEAYGEGFGGRLAIHPAQVDGINESFTPSPHGVASARRVVAAFAEQAGAGVIALDGRMLDLPHLRQARAVLAAAAALGAEAESGGGAAR